MEFLYDEQDNIIEIMLDIRYGINLEVDVIPKYRLLAITFF